MVKGREGFFWMLTGSVYGASDGRKTSATGDVGWETSVTGDVGWLNVETRARWCWPA